MYTIYSIHDTMRVPPNELGGDLKKTILGIARNEYDGLLDEDLGVVVATTEVENVGEGKVIPGDGAVYYDADLKMLIYKPEMHEVVEGFVSEVTEFGAFIRTGPIECLIHVSQIMDDYINYDAKLPGFIGKETNKKLILGDHVLARIVTISLKGNVSSSKIGLTMRQEGLGKDGWEQIDAKTKKGKEKERVARSEKKAEKEEDKK
ncbi:MAG: DNA-directed RNA polymerase [Candidatus Diapherotrites archaeon]